MIDLTCRELLDSFKDDLSAAVFAPALMTRVERVLSLMPEATEENGYSSGYCLAIQKVKRLLDGEEP